MGDSREARNVESIVNEPARHPNQFMANLTAAMRSTAESARQASLGEARSAAAARVEQLRAQIEHAAENVSAEVEEDVAAIRDQSRAEMAAVRTETERRTSLRREALGRELEGLKAAAAREEAAVRDRVAVFEGEVSRFFDRLLEGNDPSVFTAMASQMPELPVFDRDRSAPPVARGPVGDATGADEAGPEAVPNAEKPAELEDHWWLNSPASIAKRAHNEPE